MTEFIDDNSKMFVISVGATIAEDGTIPESRFADTANDDIFNVSMGAIPIEPLEIEIPDYPIVQPPTLHFPVDELTPWGQEIKASAITGPFDSWLGEVTAVHYAAADPLLNFVQSIEVKQVMPFWGTNNAPVGCEIPQAQSQPTVARAVALPWPARHDQQLYHVAAGDIVSVISGRDGRHYFFGDELPFIGQVVKKAGAAATEANTGGAGLLTLTVRRQAMTGDPDNVAFAGASLAGLLSAAGEAVLYSNVLAIKPTNQAHGYRTGDYIFVQRRGRYYFATPTRESFLGAIVNVGPESEVDFTTSHYWVREMDPTVTYSTNSWTSTTAARTQTDPTGSGGRYGRWVDAVNLAETVSSHALSTTTGVPVIVSAFADPTDGEPYYCFSRAIDEIRFGKPTGAYSSGATITLDPCDINGVDNGLANVTVQAGYTMPYSTTIPTSAIVPFIQAADGLWYVVGIPREVMTNIQFATPKIQAKYRYDFGLFTGTESGWQDIVTGSAYECPTP